MELEIGDIVYYARALNLTGTFEVLDLKIRTVTDTYFVGVETRTKHSHLFGFSELGTHVFSDRKTALEIVKDAEEEYIKNRKEVDYEQGEDEED